MLTKPLNYLPLPNTVFKENCFYLKLLLIFSFKIDSIILDPDLDPDPN